MQVQLQMQIKHLPPSVRRRYEKALGLAKGEEEHKVFVYGTLLSGERNACCAGNARRQKAWTLGTLYDTGWRFPAFVKSGDTFVKGEVLTVDDEGLVPIDRLEGYPRLYRREKVEVRLVGGGSVLAWVYVMNDLPANAPVIKSGDWSAYRKAGYRNAEADAT